MSDQREGEWQIDVVTGDIYRIGENGIEYMTLAEAEAKLNEHERLREAVEIEHEQVCQFIRDMYTGRFAEREEHYWELPQWIRDAIEADPIYNSPAGE